MKYLIVNLFEIFQNAYSEPGWQLWRGSDLLGTFRTRASAREARDARIAARAAAAISDSEVVA